LRAKKTAKRKVMRRRQTIGAVLTRIADRLEEHRQNPQVDTSQPDTFLKILIDILRDESK
jgi:hypothetical protein